MSGIVLAGGASVRLGQDKALVEVAGQALVERVVDVLRALTDEIVLVTPAPERLAWLGLRCVEDVYPGVGTLGGLHAGLNAIHGAWGLVVGCDMPFLNCDLLAYMIGVVNAEGGEHTGNQGAGQRLAVRETRFPEGGQKPGFEARNPVSWEVVMPRIGRFYEPLHALYARSIVPVLEQRILAGQRRIRQACEGLRTRYIQEDEIAAYDPDHLSFFNVNTPEDLDRARAVLGARKTGRLEG